MHWHGVIQLGGCPLGTTPQRTEVFLCLAPVHHGVVSAAVDRLHVPDEETAKKWISSTCLLEQRPGISLGRLPSPGSYRVHTALPVGSQ